MTCQLRTSYEPIRVCLSVCQNYVAPRGFFNGPREPSSLNHEGVIIAHREFTPNFVPEERVSQRPLPLWLALSTCCSQLYPMHFCFLRLDHPGLGKPGVVSEGLGHPRDEAISGDYAPWRHSEGMPHTRFVPASQLLLLTPTSRRNCWLPTWSLTSCVHCSAVTTTPFKIISFVLLALQAADFSPLR